MPATFAVNLFALAGVQASSQLGADLGDCVADRAGAADRPRGAVERREEPVRGRVELPPAEARELRSHGFVVASDEVVPGAIAELDGPRGRVDDICE